MPANENQKIPHRLGEISQRRARSTPWHRWQNHLNPRLPSSPEMLRRDELDAALRQPSPKFVQRPAMTFWTASPSRRSAKSTASFSAHRKPLEESAGNFFLRHTASLTSVNLLKVAVSRKKNLFSAVSSRWKIMKPHRKKDFVLLIGDSAIDFQRAPKTPFHKDLRPTARPWTELTNFALCFYAVWALRARN